MIKNAICFLVDDDEDDREIFGLAAENLGVSVITAENGLQALEILNAETTLVPNFIFVDLNMPYMSGRECLTHVKKIPRLNDVPVIVYTTSSYDKDIDDVKRLGATHYLVKPPSLSILSNMLTRILNQDELPYYLAQSEKP